MDGDRAVGWGLVVTPTVSGIHAMLWTGSSLTDLMPYNEYVSYANAVSGANIAGSYDYGGYPDYAMLWIIGQPQPMGLDPDSSDDSVAYAASGSLQAGYVTPGGKQHAALWSGPSEPCVDLHPTNWDESCVQAASGTLQAGWVMNDYYGYKHAALWAETADSFVDLGHGKAEGIWTDGHTTYVVGDDDVSHAILWKICDAVDLVADSMTWDSSQGGLDFQYEVRSNALFTATTAKLYWANVTESSTNILDLIYSLDIPVGSYGVTSVQLPQSLFDSRPAGATHVFLVLDPDNLVQETDESNNAKTLPLNLPVVVLVRGLQFVWATSALEYWSDATAYLSTNFEVWVCNRISGKENVDLGALELHTFLQSKMMDRDPSLPRLQNLSILAHSYGGLISRAYLRNRRSGLWSDDPAVDKVVMLSTPNCGSHAADLGLAVGWIPCWAINSEDALRCLRTSYVQWVFNPQCGDLAPQVPFYLFGATGGWRSWLLSIPWGLLFKWPIPPNPNDGVVTTDSAHGYAGLRPILIRQVGGFELTTGDDHSSICSSLDTLSSVQAILLGDSIGTTTKAREKASDPIPLPVVLVGATNGILQAMGTLQASFLIDDCTNVAFTLDCSAGQVGLSLTSPGGAVISPETTNAGIYYTLATNSDSVHASYAIDNPSIGTWSVNLQVGLVSTNGASWSLLATEQSDLAVAPTTQYFQNAGNVAVSAMLANSTQAVSGAVLSAAIQRPDGTTDQIPLYDDGTHGDGAASDGIYANSYSLSTNAGIYTVRYSATGTNAQGHTFVRVEAGSFQIGPRTASLSGAYSDQGVDLGPPPGLEEVAVNVGVQVATAGVYSVSAVLADGAGNELVSAATAPTALSMGATNLTLYFDADQLRRSTNDGPYLLIDVVLWDDSSGPSLRADFATNAYWTAPYARTNFSDLLPPQAINDLYAVIAGPTSVTLQWSAPDSEGKAAASYSIRYRQGGLWPAVWDTAGVVSGAPVPGTPGKLQVLTVNGLQPDTSYYFGIKSADETGNESDLSNVLLVRLPPAVASVGALASGQFQCRYVGQPGSSYVIQASTNLINWVDLVTNTASAVDGSLLFTDSTAAGFRQRFFHLRPQTGSLSTPLANLRVGLTPSSNPAVTGIGFTYTLVVTNAGPASATGVFATNQLPAGMSFVGASASQGQWTFNNGTVNCYVGTLGAASSATVSIFVTPAAAGQFTSLAGAFANEFDPVPGDNIASASTTVVIPKAALSLGVSDSPDPVTVGSNLTYTLSITNSGPQTATGVVVTNVLPAGVSFASASSSQGQCTFSAGVITCSLGALGAGSSAAVTIVVTAITTGQITNAAGVFAIETDPNASDNVATAITSVNPSLYGGGNLEVLRVGDGTQTLTSFGNSVFIDEYATNGSLVQSAAIPDSGTNALIVSGVATAEGALARSADGRLLCLAGYNIPQPYTSSVAAASALLVPRCVGTLDKSHLFSLVVTATNVYSTVSIRGMISDGANNYWGVGAGSGAPGVYYFGLGRSPAAVLNGNCRVTRLVNGNLYYTTGSGTRGLYNFTGAPMGAAPSSLVIGTGSSSSPYGFAVHPQNQLVYIADDTASSSGGILRYTNSSGTWVYTYTLGTGVANIGARGLVVDWTGGNPVLYATTAEFGAANRLIRIVDTGASAAATTLATAPANTAFRGVAFAPLTTLASALNNASSSVYASWPAGEKREFGFVPCKCRFSLWTLARRAHARLAVPRFTR